MTPLYVRRAGAWKPFSALLATPTPPSAPQAVVATAYRGGAAVTWQAPAQTGSSRILYYKIVAAGLPMMFIAPASRLKAAIPLLTNGTAYTFTVSAVNFAGEGAGAASAAVTPTAGAAALPLTWAPPTLVNPVTINWTGAQRVLGLDKDTDYIINIAAPITTGDMQLIGGRNIRLIGGQLAPSPINRALFIKGDATQTQARVIHIEGLRVSGQLNEVCDVDTQNEPGCTLRFQNLRVDAPVQGSFSTIHADLIQCWNGPYKLQLDRVSALQLDYQGLMLQPNQFGGWPAGSMGDWDLTNLELDGYLDPAIGNTATGYMIYSNGPEQVPFVSGSYLNAIGGSAGSAGFFGPVQPLDASSKLMSAIIGQKPSSDMVSAASAGVGYVSPGYLP